MKSPSKGFTIVTKGTKQKKREKFEKHQRKTTKLLSDKDTSRVEKQLKFFNADSTSYEYETKTITLKPAKAYRAISVDTIRDRPCCCSPRKVSAEQITEEEFMPGIVSEIITPIMEPQGAAQGLHRNVSIPQFRKVSSICITSSHDTAYNQDQQAVPCRIPPPCKSGTRFRAPVATQVSPIRPPFEREPPFQRESCSCSPDKLLELFEKAAQEMSAAGMMDMNNLTRQAGKGNLFITSTTSPLDMPSKLHCATCNRDECVTCVPEPKRGSCRCEENDPKFKKKKRKKQCPCQRVHDKPTSKACQCCICKGKKGKHKCDCNGKKNKKNICECPPPEPEPEIIVPIKGPPVDFDHETIQLLKEEFKIIDQIEMKEDLKLKSDMTQTVSGFGVKFKKRPPPKQLGPDEMSYEDALEYFRLHPLCCEEPPTPPDPDAIPPEDACKCDGPLPPLPPPEPSLPKGFDCECPEQEPDEAGRAGATGEGGEPGEGPLKGLKFRIEGKGSGSKGLSGVCCFDKCIK